MTDKRVVKSKELIVKTFIDLLNELGYKKITVKNLCEKANISRKTFYTHFETLELLFDFVICSHLPVATGGFYSSAISLYQKVGESPEFYERYRDIEYAFQMELRNNKCLMDILLKRRNYEDFMKIVERHVILAIRAIIDGSQKDISETCVDLQLQIIMHSAFLTTEWSFKNRDKPPQVVTDDLHYALSTSFINFVNLIYK